MILINEQLDRDKVPAEIAVFVDTTEATDTPGEYHDVVVGADRQAYLIDEDEVSLPDRSTICILIPTGKLPLWLRHGERLTDGSRYSRDRTIATMTTWRIKK